MRATFTITVGDDRTSVHVHADPGTDPHHALSLAIGCLHAEMADLRSCPAHRIVAPETASTVLANFAKTAPGRLPQRVQDAIAEVLAASVDGCRSFEDCAHSSPLSCMRYGCRATGVNASPEVPPALTEDQQ